MANTQPQVKDIFTFDPEYQYTFYLVDKINITGYVIDARDNGIVLNTLEHIPTDKIIFFSPILKDKKDETE
jgi:hypothetical protein